MGVDGRLIHRGVSQPRREQTVGGHFRRAEAPPPGLLRPNSPHFTWGLSHCFGGGVVLGRGVLNNVPAHNGAHTV